MSASLIIAALHGLEAILVLAVATWAVSVAKRDVSIVDGMWSIFIFAAGLAYASSPLAASPRASWLIALWAARLAIYITWRNWGEEEDRRYQAIRARNEPGFPLKSLYLVFALQAVLAWLVSAPLLAALTSARPTGLLEIAGAVVVLFGIAFEAIADLQLARFKSDPQSKGRVLDHGLWRYSRHPNYFGEFCVWWGFYLIALGAGGWWAIVSPLLMSALLLKVSGVTLLEKDISERRPAYRKYIERTSAFFPGPRKASR